jgi:hypothetical protein
MGFFDGGKRRSGMDNHFSNRQSPNNNSMASTANPASKTTGPNQSIFVAISLRRASCRMPCVMAPRYRMRPCFVALNNNMSDATRSATLPLKSAQARKKFSVTVIVPSLWSRRPTTKRT